MSTPTGQTTTTFAPYPAWVGYALIGIATALVTIAGTMRPASTLVVGAGIAALYATTRAPRPITGRAALASSIVIAAGIAALETSTVGTGWPWLDAAQLTVAAAIALLITGRHTTH